MAGGNVVLAGHGLGRAVCRHRTCLPRLARLQGRQGRRHQCRRQLRARLADRCCLRNCVDRCPRDHAHQLAGGDERGGGRSRDGFRSRHSHIRQGADPDRRIGDLATPSKHQAAGRWDRTSGRRLQVNEAAQTPNPKPQTPNPKKSPLIFLN